MANTLFETPIDIERAARFDRSDHLENLGGIDLDNGAGPDGRKHVAFHPVQDSLGVGRVEPFDAVGVPSPCDRLKELEGGPLLLGLGWVLALVEQRLCFVSLAGDRRVTTGYFPKLSSFSLPSKRYLRRQSFEPLGRTSRCKPYPTVYTDAAVWWRI